MHLVPGPVQCALRRSPPLALLAAAEAPRPLVLLLGGATIARPCQQPTLQSFPRILQHGRVEEGFDTSSTAVAAAAPAAAAPATAAPCAGSTDSCGSAVYPKEGKLLSAEGCTASIPHTGNWTCIVRTSKVLPPAAPASAAAKLLLLAHLLLVLLLLWGHGRPHWRLGLLREGSWWPLELCARRGRAARRGPWLPRRRRWRRLEPRAHVGRWGSLLLPLLLGRRPLLPLLLGRRPLLPRLLACRWPWPGPWWGRLLLPLRRRPPAGLLPLRGRLLRPQRSLCCGILRCSSHRLAPLLLRCAGPLHGSQWVAAAHHSREGQQV